MEKEKQQDIQTLDLVIKSNGTSAETEIVDSKTGKMLTNVKSITWHVEAGEIATASVELIVSKVELSGKFTAVDGAVQSALQ